MNIKRTPNQRIYSCWIDEYQAYYYSQDFSNTVIPEFDPQAMSNFGLMMIVVWGLLYSSIQNFDQVKWLIAVFMIEKLNLQPLDKMDTDNKITDVLER
jgi:hypothetical protein